MLQLWRPGSPCQRVQVTTPAQKVPLLSEHRTHGCQLPSQTTSVITRFSRKTVSIKRGGRAAPSLGGASEMCHLNRKSGNSCQGTHKGQPNCFDTKVGHTINFCLLKLLLKLPQVKKKTLFSIFMYNTQRNCIIALRMLS